MSVISKDNRVRFVSVGTVISASQRSPRGVLYQVRLDREDNPHLDYFFYDRDLAIVGTAPANEAWREIVADAIRIGDDRRALELLIAELHGREDALTDALRPSVLLLTGYAGGPICQHCMEDPDPRGWSACGACRMLRDIL